MPSQPAGAVVGAPAVERVARLGPGEVRAVQELLHRATEVDGVAPLSEHVVLHLRRGGEEPGVHLLLHRPAGPGGGAGQAADGRVLVAYAHLDPTDVVAGASAELVVHPEHRRQGHGRALVQELLALAAEVADGRLRLWAHGESPDASALAQAMGFTRSRELWQLRRSLRSSLPQPELPAGVRVRAFRVAPAEALEADAAAVLAVNAAAFADHPEQGRWTRRDLDARLAEAWFDPEGLFLAHDVDPDGREGPLLGFHWTKVHGAGHSGPADEHAGHGHYDDHGHDHGSDHGHDPVGEVYVVGVSPRAQGRGLGRVLTLVGLRHLRARGLDQAMLYVDADNAAAVRTYTSLGFTRWDVDVQFSRDG